MTSSEFRRELLYRYANANRSRDDRLLRNRGTLRGNARAAVLRGFGRLNDWMNTAGDLNDRTDRLDEVLGNWQRWDETFRMLGDVESQEVLLKVLSFRINGEARAELPLSSERYGAAERVANAHLLEVNVQQSPIGPLNRYRFDVNGQQLDLVQHHLNAVETFALEQYCCRRAGIAPKPGDHVIDGGACWGDTALFFAACTGPTGSVTAFEFVPENLAVLERNLAMNPDVGGRVEVVRHALWDSSGATLNFDVAGPATRVAESTDESARVSSISIVDWMNQSGQRRIDFVKLDVEGAEQQVLNGAEAILRSTRPQLAISVYHRDDDLYAIPGLLRDFGYQHFHLDHFTTGRYETVLFAR